MSEKDKLELYSHITKRLKSLVGKIEKSTTISEENKKIMLDFLTKMVAEGTAPTSQVTYLYRLIPIAERLGSTSFGSCTKEQMMAIFAEYRTTGQMTQVSVNKSIGCLKAFYRWLFDLSPQDAAPDVVKWMRKAAEPPTVRPEDLWTEEEVSAVMAATGVLRTKAMMGVLYETGLRPGELRSMKMRDVVFNGDMARIYVRGKMEKRQGERCVPILKSCNLLKAWIDSHPGRGNSHAWVWSKGKRPMPETYLRTQMRELARKAGITKPNNPYILRHSALTRFYKEMPSKVAKDLAGHKRDSNMMDVYCHLSDEDMENSIREMNGLPRKESAPVARNCGKCGRPLDIGSLICGGCGLIQNTQGAVEHLEYEDGLRKLGVAVIKLAEKNPKLVEMLMKET